MKKLIKRTLIVSTILTVTVIAGDIFYWDRLISDFHNKYDSPDGNFYVIVERIPMLVSMLGSGSDARAIVSLHRADNKLLMRTRVPMIQVIELKWEDDAVKIWNQWWKL